MSKTNLWIVEKCIARRHSLHAKLALEITNFWCKSLSRWLTLSHFSYIIAMRPSTKSIRVRSATATIHLRLISTSLSAFSCPLYIGLDSP